MEISFSKGDVFDIISKTGKWWSVRTASGEHRSGQINSFCVRSSLTFHIVSCAIKLFRVGEGEGATQLYMLHHYSSAND